MKKINDIVVLDITKIKPNPFQPRQVFDDASLNELALSIKQYGVLQPITVRSVDDHFELIMGERRFRASQLLELNAIPAVIIDVGDEDSAVVALIENLQRVDLSYIEEAESYRQLITIHGLTQGELSDRVGKSQSAISNKLRILRLDSSVLDDLKNSKLSERHARALLKIKDPKRQLIVLRRVIKQKMTVKETEDYISKQVVKYKKNNQSATYKVDHKIYLNTIKKAFEMVRKMSDQAIMEVDDLDDTLEIKIKIPKN